MKKIAAGRIPLTPKKRLRSQPEQSQSQKKKSSSTVKLRKKGKGGHDLPKKNKDIVKPEEKMPRRTQKKEPGLENGNKCCLK